MDWVEVLPLIGIVALWPAACIVCALKGRVGLAIVLGPLGVVWITLGAAAGAAIAIVFFAEQSPQHPLSGVATLAAGGAIGALLVLVFLIIVATIEAFRRPTPTSWWATRRTASRFTAPVES